MMIRKLSAALGILLCVASAYAQTRMISHVTRVGGGFTTTVIVENLAVSDQTVQLSPFNASGEALAVKEVSLSSLEVLSQSVAELFEIADSISHFTISDNSNVAVSVSYNFDSPNGSPAQVSSSDVQAGGWRLFPGDWSQIFDGIAVVNTGDVATDVWISQKDGNGNFIQSARVAAGLAPNAKALYVIGSPDGSDFSPIENSYFEIYADQKMGVTALRGTLASAPVGLLWSNVTRDVSQATSKRDEAGVWFIKAGDSLWDVYEMMGYNAATDRMWQAHVFRRSAEGRLAEMFGPNLVGQDIDNTVLAPSPQELEQIWANLDTDSKTIVQAYVHGFNRRLSYNVADPAIMPYEFGIVGIFDVEPWNYMDVLAWTSLLKRNFSMDDYGSKQLEHMALYEELLETAGGDADLAGAMFNDLRWIDDPLTPTMKPSNLAKNRKPKTSPIPVRAKNMPAMGDYVRNMLETREENAREGRRVGAKIKGGSYAWVVSGDKTASGNPIIYAGPQMGFRAPVDVVEGSVESDVLTISGMHIAGNPTFVMGRTPHHAWSLQVGHAHTWDFYIEDPEDVEVDHVRTINVLNGDPREHTIYRTSHGRVFRASTEPLADGEPIFAWSYSETGNEHAYSQGLHLMATATSMEEFTTAASNAGGSNHITYADKDGNIAYWHTGKIPVRPEGDYRFPQGYLGDPIEYDVANVYPVTHDSNPARGWYGGWNNRSTQELPENSATFTYGPFQRAHIVEDFLANGDNFTFEEIRELALDVAMSFSVNRGGNMWPILDEAGWDDIVLANATPERETAIALLNSWNSKFVPGEREDWLALETLSDPFILLRDWVFEVVEMTFEDEYSHSVETDPQRMAYERLGVILHQMLPASNQPNNYDWFQNTSDPNAPQTAEDIISTALDRVLGNLGPRPWGADRSRGRTGYSHFLMGLIYSHPFFNRATYAQVVEYTPEGPSRIESHFALGQSGFVTIGDDGALVLDDKFYSMRDLFLEFNYRSFPLFGSDSSAKKGQ